MLEGEPDKDVTVTIPRRWRKDRVLHVHLPGTPGMSSYEVAEWLAYERLEGPQDVKRLDFIGAQVSQTLVGLQTKKGKKVPPLDKFVVKYGEKQPGSGLEMLHKIILANRAAGGDDLRGAKLPPMDGEGEL